MRTLIVFVSYYVLICFNLKDVVVFLINIIKINLEFASYLCWSAGVIPLYVSSSSSVDTSVLICDLLFRLPLWSVSVKDSQEKGFVHARQVGSLIWRRDTLMCGK